MNGLSSDICADETTPLNFVLMGFRSSSESNNVQQQKIQFFGNAVLLSLKKYDLSDPTHPLLEHKALKAL